MKPNKSKKKKKQIVVPCGLRIRFMASESSTFEKLFSFLLPEFSEYKWLVEWEAFDFPWYEWDDEKEEQMEIEIEAQRQLIGDFYLIDTNFLTKYIMHVNDFWNALYGFSNLQTNWENWNNLRYSTKPEEQLNYIIKTTDIFFDCIDGAYWEIYTKHEDIIHRLFEKYSNSEPIKNGGIC